MTLLEYVTSLQDQGLSEEEVFAKAQEWKKENQPKEEKVEVETIEEGKPPAVAETDTTVTAETNEVSEPSDSGDGELQLDPIATQNLDIINQRALRFKEQQDFENNIDGVKTDAILKKFKPGTDERAAVYYQLNLAPDETVDKNVYDAVKQYDEKQKNLEKFKKGETRDAYGVQDLLPEVDFSSVKKALSGVDRKEGEAETEEEVKIQLTAENLDNVSKYMDQLAEDPELKDYKSIDELMKKSKAEIAGDVFLINMPLGLESAWEGSKATFVDFIDKSMKAMGQTPEFLIEAKAEKDPNAIEFIDPDTDEKILFSENPEKWKELKDKKLSGEDIASFMTGKEEEIGSAAENYIIKQYKKYDDLQKARINVGEIVKDFDWRNPSKTKFASGDELFGGVLSAIEGTVSSVIPAMLTRGASLIPQMGAPMYIDYNVEKAKRLYGDDPDAVAKLVRNGETEIATPAALTAVSASLEYIGFKGVSKYLLGRTGTLKPFLTLVGTQNKEGVTELLQTGVEEVNNSIANGDTLGKAAANALETMASKKGVNSYLMGVLGSGVISAPTAISNTVTNALITETQVFNQAADLIKKTADLQSLRTENNNKDFRAAIDIQINQTEQDLKDLLENTNKLSEIMTKEEQSEVLDLLNKKKENNTTLEKLNSDYADGKLTAQQYGAAKGSLTNSNKRITSEVDRVRANANERLLKGEIEVVEDIVGKEKVNVFETTEEFVEATGQDADFDAFVNPEGEIFINKQRAAQVGSVTAGSHELLHRILKSTFNSNPETALKLVEDFKSILSEKERNIVQKRIDENYADASAEVQAEEYLTAFSDAIGKEEITFTDNLKESFMRLAKPILDIFRPKGYSKLEFESGRDVYNFIKDYQKNIKKGKISERAQELQDLGEVDLGIIKKSVRNREIASNEVQELYDSQGEAAAFEIIEKFKPITSKIVEARSQAPNFDRQLLTDEIETGKRGIFDLIREYKPESGVPLAAYINKFLPARAIEASQRVLGEEFTTDVTEAKGVVTEEVTETVEEKPTKLTKPSSLLPAEAVTEITEQVKEKIKGIDPKSMTFKKLGDLAPEVIAREIGIPVKKLTDPRANLSKGDATAIQQFVNKNADKLLRILPEGSVTEAATDDILGTSTGVPTGLLKAFYTKGKRSTRGAGLTPFIKNKNISKADFLEAFGIVEGKKAEGFSARSPQAQALKGIASLYGRLVTNEVSRSPEVGLKPEAKQRVAAGKAKTMASKRIDNAFQSAKIEKGSIDFSEYNINYNKTLNAFLKDTGVSRIDMTTESGRKRFLDFAVESGLTKKLPPSFWLSLAFTSDSALTEEVKQELKEAGIVGDTFTFDGSSLREFKGNLPFRNTIEVREWISKTGKKNFAKETDAFSDMIKVEGVFAAKNNLETQLSNPDFIKRQDNSINELGNIFKLFQNEIMRNPDGTMNFEGVAFVGALLSSSSSGQNHFLRKAAPYRFYQKGYIEAGSSATTLEHTMPATIVGKYLFMQALNGSVNENFKYIKNNYFQGPLLKYNDKKLKGKKPNGDKFNYISTMPENWKVTDNVWARYFNINVANTSGGINPADIMLNKKESILDKFNIMSSGLVINEATKKQIPQVEALNDSSQPKSLASKRASTQQQIHDQGVLDKALAKGRRSDPEVKKIRVFDFDDTLATSKSQVIVTMPLLDPSNDMVNVVARRLFKKEFENIPSYKQNFKNLTEEQKIRVLKEIPGKTKKINATQFAAQAADLEAQGATFDFTEFSKVIDGKKGPLFNVAKKIADTRGTEDLFILTARPQDAAGPIKAFMKSLGIDIPLKNITGLGDGTAQAKGMWIAGKAAEGYNDFYFADDATKNVKAVKDVLDQIDVKSRVQVAKASKRKTFDTIVNDMIFDSSGIETYKQFSAAKAKTVGANKGKYNFLIPASAEDFTGLLYKMLGKGKKGDAQMAFLKTNLLDPYMKAEDTVVQAKMSAANDFMALKQQFPGLPKTFRKETGIGGFTYQHAIRTYIWTQQGMSIPGLSKADIRKLNGFIKNDPKLQAFADQLISIQKGKLYPEPGKDWLGGNLTTDIIGGINKVNRAEAQQEFRENLDIIFSPENLNKMEAAYGTRWRRAMEDSIRRMKAGTNRPIGSNPVTEKIFDWLNNSVGAVMFLNTRSALLQTISAVNFINWGDNNIVAAGKAFANQKQYWKDFMSLMNSDYLVQRRNGLKINVSESEIADAVKDSKNKPRAAIAFLLSKGFVMTRFADSFAIASGGATFYRNRIKKYIKEGMDQKLAEEKAFDDFRALAEENQQSSDPSKISMQQASAAGRVILAWANTPMQYARIQKRSAQDLIAGRGDWKTHVSKIAYYGFVQNLIFNALQQALFAIGFGDDDEDEDPKKKARADKKIARVANGMLDSQLKGLGIAGTAVSALKNMIVKLYDEHGKKTPEYEAASVEALGFSPPLNSKYRKLVGGLKSFSWNRKEMKEKGFSLDNPAYLAGAQIISAFTNVPIDRVVKKANNVRGLLSNQTETWQKVALGLGWGTYDIGLPYYGGWDKPKDPTPEEIKQREFDTMKKDTKTADQVQMLLDLGLDKKQIKALRYEDARVKKIIELQNKKKDAGSQK